MNVKKIALMPVFGFFIAATLVFVNRLESYPAARFWFALIGFLGFSVLAGFAVYVLKKNK